MEYKDIFHSEFSEPAVIISYKDNGVSILDINERFIPELWMNVSKDAFISAFPGDCFDEENLQHYISAIEACIATGQEQTVDTWRLIFSNCCGFDKVCIKSRLVLVSKDGDEAVIFEGIRNISNEKRIQDTLEDVEYRYKNASEQINIYNWEYTIATKEMRPCYRCMRDLGLPALVTNYPEPAIDMGIFPPDYADMYRDMMRRIDAGETDLEADIPLTVGRIPFRIKYTTKYDEKGAPIKAFGSATLISETELGRIKLDNQIIARLAEEYSCIYLAQLNDNTVKTVKASSILPLSHDTTCEEFARYIISRSSDIPEDQKNLLSNAYKYTPAGGSVFLKAKLLEKKAAARYEIRIRDTGIGMSEEFLEHIGEAFSREETDIVRETQGTGLGMVIVRNIVNLMHGTIDIVSKSGKGSEFIIVLPFELSQGGTSQKHKNNKKDEALNKDYSGVTVLVVDDTDVNLVLAKSILSKYGFSLKLAESGIEALQQIKDLF